MNKTLSENNFDIKLKEHFKLYVLLKDKIIFETELQNCGIKYYTEINEQQYIDSGIRYFFLDTDMQKIDKIIIDNGIIANTESNMIRDYRDSNKIEKFYFLIVGIIIALVILIAIISTLFD